MFFFNDAATTEIYTLSLHDALPIWPHEAVAARREPRRRREPDRAPGADDARVDGRRAVRGSAQPRPPLDRKSTRLNSSHANISYAVFCLKKKNNLISGNSIIAYVTF